MAGQGESKGNFGAKPLVSTVQTGGGGGGGGFGAVGSPGPQPKPVPDPRAPWLAEAAAALKAMNMAAAGTPEFKAYAEGWNQGVNPAKNYTPIYGLPQYQTGLTQAMMWRKRNPYKPKPVGQQGPYFEGDW